MSAHVQHPQQRLAVPAQPMGAQLMLTRVSGAYSLTGDLWRDCIPPMFSYAPPGCF